MPTLYYKKSHNTLLSNAQTVPAADKQCQLLIDEIFTYTKSHDCITKAS
jgi:hypothetical protein